VRILMTLTAAVLATTAVVSSASAESIIGCDSGIPLSSGASADNCAAWGIVSPPLEQSAFAYVTPRTKMVAPRRAHNTRKTDVHGGAGE
jgi:hypothetical protein